MEGIILRLILSTAILLASAAGWELIRRLSLRRAGTAAAELEGYQRGEAALIYFSSPVCVPCRAIQRPAVDRFRSAVGSSIRVIEVDTIARPDIAARWGVFSLPTTVFVDPRGQPRTVNPGVATTETLLAQARLLHFPTQSKP